jgi:hypothetical protein
MVIREVLHEHQCESADLRREDGLSGVVPESQNCIDCGCNTLPAFSTRAEAEQMIAEQTCGGPQEMEHSAGVERPIRSLLVHDHVWKAAGHTVAHNNPLPWLHAPWSSTPQGLWSNGRAMELVRSVFGVTV